MSVPSFEFLLYVGIVAAVLAGAASSAAWRRGILLVANLAFFATFADSAASLIPFAAFLTAGFASMRLCAASRSRLVLWTSLTVLIVGFCWLKRYAFLPTSLQLDVAYTTVGLSYAFFRVVGVTVDAAQGALRGPVGPID